VKFAENVKSLRAARFDVGKAQQTLGFSLVFFDVQRSPASDANGAIHMPK
jgi:hypothetical protein